MKHLYLRLDDASDYMDLDNWTRMEALLDKYGVKPIFGIIPENRDDTLVSKYQKNPDFWGLVYSWIEKGWTPALHGCYHKYVTTMGGVNPVNKRSEFAGLPYEKQAEKIRIGYQLLAEKGIEPDIFFAPSHTFDENTLKAIEKETPIRIISDTIATDVYRKGSFCFIPQQSGVVRNLPFKTVTFCYHPNTMKEKDYSALEQFLELNRQDFSRVDIKDLLGTSRKKNLVDNIFNWLYFARRRI